MTDKTHGLVRTPFASGLSALSASFILLVCCSSLMSAQTGQELTSIYDSYLKAVKAGSYSQTSSFLSAEVRNDLKTPSSQTEYMETMKVMAPVQYQTEFVNLARDGQSAEVTVVETIAVPEQFQKEQNLPPTQKAEVILKFVKEAGQWKMASPLMLGDPDKRERPKDLNMGSRADYAEGANTDVGGAILKAQKQDAGTVYVLRMLDQEIAVFVPAAKVSSEFVTGSILEVRGAENKTDKLKLWAEDAALYKEPASK